MDSQSEKLEDFSKVTKYEEQPDWNEECNNWKEKYTKRNR